MPASLAEILKEIDRAYTGKSTMELLAELPKKRKPGRQPGWRKPVKVADPDSPEARGIQPSKPGDDDYVVPDYSTVTEAEAIAKFCGAQFNHRHHIVQIQNGGLNKPINLVLLCKSCHREVHRG